MMAESGAAARADGGSRGSPSDPFDGPALRDWFADNRGLIGDRAIDPYGPDVYAPDPWAGEPERDWQERALCSQTDPEAFFPEKGGSTREAKKICTVCDVRVECLEYALAKDERFGIWGGLSERERRKLRKRAV